MRDNVRLQPFNRQSDWGSRKPRIPLSQAVIELSLSPKSNSAITAIDSALSDIRKGNIGQIPDHLRDGHYAGAKDLGRAIGYKYPHNYENGHVIQQYLPDKLKNKIYYEPKSTSKSEQQFKTIYDNLRNKNKKTMNQLAIINDF